MKKVTTILFLLLNTVLTYAQGSTADVEYRAYIQDDVGSFSGASDGSFGSTTLTIPADVAANATAIYLTVNLGGDIDGAFGFPIQPNIQWDAGGGMSTIPNAPATLTPVSTTPTCGDPNNGGIYIDTDLLYLDVTAAATGQTSITFQGEDFGGAFETHCSSQGLWFEIVMTYSFSTLPVELLSFDAQRHSIDLVNLNWATASEINNEGFAIQRSTNGVGFEEIAFVNGNGTTSEEHFYNYTDTAPELGINYYRLKQVDYDGGYEYSDIISVQVDGGSAYSIYPNPTTGVLHISKKSSYSIINSQGQEVLRGIDNRVDVSGLPLGLYYTRLGNGAIERFVKK